MTSGHTPICLPQAPSRPLHSSLRCAGSQLVLASAWVQRLRTLLFGVLACAALVMPPLAQAEVRYLYDELSRLRAVIDTTSETAIYSYDAVGNLTKITRQSSSLVSIIELLPDSGPVGTSVKIYGTGFSTTPASNTVKFNGTTATVTASTATEITTTVPTGATTGLITVTTPTGSATSATNFTVAVPAGAPTISSFSPTIAGYGTTVTINGTNFSTTVANNKVKTNVANADLTSATAIKLTTTVTTQATSGRITVTTSTGTATSTADLFVAPYPNLASAVGFTGRMAFGETKSVTISTANKFGIVVFDGVAGQTVSLSLGSGTITGYSVYVNSPLGPQLVGTSGGTSGWIIDPFSLPMTGTYSIIVAPQSSYVGTVPLTLNTITDVSGTIVPGGPPVTVTTTIPGQNARLTFSGTAGQRVSLAVSGSTMGYTNMSLLQPNGTALTSGSVSAASGYIFDATTLPVDGTYTILVDPQGATVGSMTLTAYDVPADATSSIVPGGPAVTLTTTVPGQNAKWTFSGSANQRVSYAVANSTMGFAQLRLLAPDGAILSSTSVVSFTEPQTLPSSGTYALVIDPSGTAVGSATVTLYDVPPDMTGPIVPGGPPVTGTTTAPGQNASLTFTGTANQRVSLAMSGSTFGFNVNVYLKKPDGTILASIAFGGATGFLDAQTLPVSGTYILFIDPTGTNTGTAQFTLYDVPADVTGTIVPGGPPVTVTTTTVGQNASLTFTGTANQRVSLAMSGSTFGFNVNVYLKKPDGTILASIAFGGATGFLDAQTLPVSGTYILFIDPTGTNTGTAQFTLYDIVDVTGALTVGGAAMPVTISVPGQNGRLTFTGTAGQQVTVSVTSNTMSYVVVSLLKPDGTTATSLSLFGTSGNLAQQTLATSGTYTVVVDPQADRTGGLNVAVTSP